jgi:hypothetical protein
VVSRTLDEVVDASPAEDRRNQRRPGPLTRFGPLLLATPPALWMTSYVLGGGRMPFNDYWFMANVVFQPNGGIDVSSLLTFQNEHPVIIPDLLYWANARLTGGSNIVLGLVVIAVVFAQVVIVSRFVDERHRRSAVSLALIAASGVLLYSRQGAHLFFAAYSAPIANLFVLGAILARSRGRTWLAVGLGMLASICNAAGLAVWPALVVTGMVKDRRWRPDPAVVAYGILLVIGYLALRNTSPVEADAGVVDAARAAAAVAGSVLANSLGMTQIVGAVGMVAGAILTFLAVTRGQGAAAAPWVGAFVFAVTAAALIGRGRAGLVESYGVGSRYASVSAIFLLAVLGLAAIVFHFRWMTLAPIIVVGLLAVRLGGDQVDQFIDLEPEQEEFAAAMRLDLADGYTYLPYYGYPRVAPLLEDFGHYPFDGSWDGDCGLAGQRLPPSTALDPAEGHLQWAVPLDNRRGARFFGWVPEDLVDDIDCVLITDSTRTVVGFGAVGVEDPLATIDPDRSFAAVAPLGSSTFTAFILLEDGTIRRLVGELPPPEPQVEG